MLRRILLILYFLFLFVNINYPQIEKVNFGASIGLGEISSNSPSVTALGGNLFADFTLWFSEDLMIRTGFTYLRKLEYFLPENRQGRVYPFMKLFSIDAVIQQKLNNLIFLEETAGIIYLNDRTFEVNEWMPGTQFSLLGGLDFKNDLQKGFQLGLGFKYGITFTKTSANFYMVYFQSKLFL